MRPTMNSWFRTQAAFYELTFVSKRHMRTVLAYNGNMAPAVGNDYDPALLPDTPLCQSSL